ncbi:MAG: hypothetical protein ABI925_11610 [Verrucomicrobiota bacterium]
MKLTINRSQASQKGVFGGDKGVNFSFACKVEVSEEERVLIERYGLGVHPIAAYTSGAGKSLDLRFRDIEKGFSDTRQSLGELLELEQKVLEGCREVKGLAQLRSTYGGEETIEI